MMLDEDTIRDWHWKDLLRGKINSQRRNRHFNTKLLNEELNLRLGDAAEIWLHDVVRPWEQDEEAWKKRLGNDPFRIDTRAGERKAADERLIQESRSFFETMEVPAVAPELLAARPFTEMGLPGA
ncbi:hypothetical protein [Noviherbaspirillum galbum]|uniref:Uncharacterized protein n=1 Tax=Noviherbaspirillum galbum TaxID=2709383 RepID=A0A6B3SMF3_9BURK|nr:hypothetical protein [Noviherbaspirillum galbum]NEX61961.1 hypothetical protein [Noviherbaspirillum galbum]